MAAFVYIRYIAEPSHMDLEGSVMNVELIRQKLKNDQISLGSWVTLGNTGIAEILSRAGFDWIVVDLEHSVISIDQAGELIRTIDGCDVVPLVRLTSNDENQIKRVMDAGAKGIIVPNISSAEEASKAVAATRYAPLGNRGVGLARAQKYGPGFQDYLKWQTEGPIVLAQIENINALSELDKIFQVEGLDGYIIGPYDLSCSMGIPGDFDNPEFKGAMQQIQETGKRYNFPSGIHSVEPDVSALEDAIERGFKIIAYSVDIRILDVGARLGSTLNSGVIK